MKKFYFIASMALAISQVFFSCSSSEDSENDINKGQIPESIFKGVSNANSIVVNPDFNDWYGIDVSRANTFWSNDDVGNADNVINDYTEWTAEVIWQDIDSRAINFCDARGNTYSGDSCNKKGIQPLYVKGIRGLKGNVIVGIKKKGAGKDAYLWSWHLWLTDEPQLISGFMDRNLGAISASPTGKNKAYGLYYQFGRKDAFVGNYYNTDLAKYDINGRFLYGGDKTEKGCYLTFTKYVNRPDMIINFSNQGSFSSPEEWSKWEKESKYFDKHWYNFTESSGKTFFDPCPEGWRLPTKDDLEKLTLDERHNCRFVYDKVVNGYSLDGNWFPQCGNYWSTGDIINSNDEYGHYKNEFQPTVWSFNYNVVYKCNLYELNRVRCIKK